MYSYKILQYELIFRYKKKRRKNIYSVSVFLEYIYYINAFKMRV